MKPLSKIRSALVLFSLAFLSAPLAHAATTPSLGAADTFAVLAHTYSRSGNPGPLMTGDFGYTTLSGTASMPTITGGTTHVSDSVYTQAGADQATALTALNNQACEHVLPTGNTIDLSLINMGSGVGIFTPGVYCTALSGAGNVTIGTAGITLSGSGTYIFRIRGMLSTAANSVVSLTNGASACDVFWTPGLGPIIPSFGYHSTFVGTDIEPEFIFINDNVTWIGRALVSLGTATFNSSINISVPNGCTPPPPSTATLHVIKTFYNDYGGTAISSDAMVHVRNGAGDVSGSPHAGSAVGTSYVLNADTYAVSEDAFPGYTAIFSGDCDASGHITLAAGQSGTCTISNDQNPPSPATLHVIKHVVNTNGDVAMASDFILHVKSVGPSGLSNVSGSPAPGAETPGTSYVLGVGAYVVSEEAFAGYISSFSGDCDASGNVTLTAGSDKTCTITNHDTPPPVVPPAALHVIKHVINNDGGTATASSFSLHVKSSGSFGLSDASGSPAAGTEAPGTPYTLAVGNYVVNEDTHTGYTSSFNGDCDATGHITLASSDNKTCTITNDDIPPPPIPGTATLHIIKVVVNNNGGTAIASQAMIHVSTGMGNVPGSPHAGAGSPGTLYALTPGSYAVSEEPFPGYTQSFSSDCTGGTVTLLSGDSKTCTITNDDIAGTIITTTTTTTPVITTTTTTTGGGTGDIPPATLHVIKIVINDNGGKAVVSDAIIHVTTGSGDVTGSPRAGASAPGTSYSLVPGTYNVSENFFPGYTVLVGGDCAVNGNISLRSGDTKTCTITNNDIAGVIIHYTPDTTSTPRTPPTSVPPTVPPGTKPPCDICQKLTYDVYIINPDGTERHTGTPWVRVTDRGNGVKRYSFEDATLDPHNPLFDYNDAVIDVDYKDCKSIVFMFVSSDASWKHQIKIKISIDGVTQSDTLVANDSKAVVGTLKIINATTGINTKIACASGSTASTGLKGKILLQVQQHGEAWYVHPDSGLRYYLKDGPAAYGLMRNFGLGITNQNLAAIPSVMTVDELKHSPSICGSNSSANKMKGKILLQVQQHGEAWYVDVTTCRRIYLRDGATAYSVMRFLGLGIADANLAKLKIGQ